MNESASTLDSERLSPPVTVRALYLEHADFVRRVLRTHGVSPAWLEDGVQDVFLVVFRRIDDFVPRATHKTWIYGIALRVAKDHRRRSFRKGGLLELDGMDLACPRPDPCSVAAAAQAWQRLRRRLVHMDAARRRVFILAELEEMTAPEIAKTLQVNLNTVYSRLRSARREFGVPAGQKPACSEASLSLG
jgi:RNA polymerase sigma-70 factor (ECF subfamily)